LAFSVMRAARACSLASRFWELSTAARRSLSCRGQRRRQVAFVHRSLHLVVQLSSRPLVGPGSSGVTGTEPGRSFLESPGLEVVAARRCRLQTCRSAIRSQRVRRQFRCPSEQGGTRPVQPTRLPTSACGSQGPKPIGLTPDARPNQDAEPGSNPDLEAKIKSFTRLASEACS
jgi:hypothetical protein